MSTPNPLAPQGSLLEKHGRGRSTFQIISFIGALHVFVLCALLWVGCKQDKPSSSAGGPDAALPGQEGGLPPVTEPPVADGTPTNTVVIPATNPPVVLTPVPGAGTPPPGPGPGPGAGVGAGGGVAPLVPGVTGAEGVGGAGTTAVAGAASEHKVAARDTGVVIAKKYGVTVAALKAANPDVNWNKLKVGQVVAIPAAAAKAPEAAAGGAAAAGGGSATAPAPAGDGSSYTVRPGDTGSKIAKKFGVAWRKIRDANGLTSDSLKPGQKLTIPAKGAPVTAPAADAPSAGPGAAGGSAVPVVTPLPATGGR